MGKIVIKDLSENVDLDRKAMQAISGGARWRSQGRPVARPPEQRIVDFKTGVVRPGPAAQGKPAK